MSVTLDRPAAATEYASFWKRLLAAVLDFIFTLPLFFVVSYFMTWSPNFNAYLISVVVLMMYRPVLEGLYGATLGKMACKLVVRKEDGGKIGFQESLLRYVPWLVPAMIGIYYATQLFALPGYLEIEGFLDMAVFMEANLKEIQTLSNVANASQLVPLLSALVIFGTSRNQAAHDLLAQTVVMER